jgi:integrase
MCAACRRHELASLKVDEVKVRDDVIVISILETKTKRPRRNCITEPLWIGLIKKYISLRPLSTAVAEGYIEDSLKAKIALANQLVGRNTSSFPAAVASTSSSSFQNIVNEHQENTQAVISEGLTTNRSVVHTRFYFSLYVFFKKKIGIFAIMN